MDIMYLLTEVLNELKNTLQADSIIGTPIVNSTFTVIPISKMSVGFATGGADLDKKTLPKSQSPIGAVGGGATVTPIGFLILDEVEAKFIKTEGGEKWNDCIESVISMFSHK